MGKYLGIEDKENFILIIFLLRQGYNQGTAIAFVDLEKAIDNVDVKNYRICWVEKINKI